MEPRKFIEDIIRALIQLQQSPQPARSGNSKVYLPRMIGIGNGRQIIVSEEIDKLIADFARQKMNTNTSLKTHFSVSEFRKLVRAAFGLALVKIDLADDISKNVDSVLNDVDTAIDRDTTWISTRGQREYAFGCTLFSFDDVAPFAIGPVRFEPRPIWLDRKASDGRSARIGSGGRIERFGHNIADGAISKIMKRRIIRAWQGQKLRTRKPSADSVFEQSVLEAIGKCPYVCSVKVSGLGDKAGEDKALLAARLALTTISLNWEKPSAALNGLNLRFDREMRNQTLLSFTADGIILGGGSTSNMPHAPWVERGELESHLQKFNANFTTAGEAIEWLLDPIGPHNRPKLQSIITQAMLWFHDGCREIFGLKAIVSFASCMDILASGGGRKSICNLIRARLEIDEGAIIHRDGFTVKEVIDQIYGEGRVRFIHGPIQNGKHIWGDKLGHDWSEKRGLAEWLARNCLVSCLGQAAEHLGDDSPDLFLK